MASSFASSTADELNHWAPIRLQKMQALPQLTDVASDQQSAGPTLKVAVNRDISTWIA
jgi:multidrug efflux pump subunit AcrB